jgi:hypothetical protein
MVAEWYYSHDGQRHGPVSFDELKPLVVSGQLLSTDLVWKQGMPNWALANTVCDFSNVPPPFPSTRRAALEHPDYSGTPQVRHQTMAENSGSSTALIAAGYICGGLSLFLLPPALGLAGIVCGIVNLVRERTGHGIAQIVISVTCAIFGMIIGYASMASR